MKPTDEKVPLALFCRPPVEGKTKTRLIPAVGASRAAELYQAFVTDVIVRCGELEETVLTLWWSEEPLTQRSMVDMAGHGALPEQIQQGNDLGERMAHALRTMCDRAGVGMILGSDAPTIPPRFVRLAARLLRRGETDVVLGAAADGGYYLVGSSVPMNTVFQGVRWSTECTLLDTVGAAKAQGYRVSILPPWYDVDTEEDLRMLRAHLAESPEAAPHTAQALAKITS